MKNLYQFIETNDIINEENKIKKIELLYDLKSKSSKFLETNFNKIITCISGSCNLIFSDDAKQEKFLLNSPCVTVLTKAGIKVEINNFTRGTKVSVVYTLTGENK